MATYNNKHWLLSHIRNSYIATDDTGMCEAVMLSDDLPNRFIEMCKTRRATQPSTSAQHASKSHPNHQQHHHGQQYRSYQQIYDDNFEWYPGLDQSDDEDIDPMLQSYDILMDQDHGLGPRKHNNIAAHKMDKKDTKRRVSKVKSIKLDDNVVALNGDEIDDFFPRRNGYQTDAGAGAGTQTDAAAANGSSGADDAVHEKAVSLLAKRLEEVSRQPVNEFQQYAQFDGNQMSIHTKTFKIFLTMLPKEQQNYPMDVCVVASAKIQEFIGLICYKCSITYDIELLSIQHYALYITEGDGEIDDFPPLDTREPCGKFRFSHLALVQRHKSDIPKADSRPLSETESTFNSRLSLASSNDRAAIDLKDLERMKDHTVQMEAPLYRSYHVKMMTRGLFKAFVQLGISGDKMEIDPIQTQNSKFFRQKPISHSMETVVYCDITDRSRSRAVIRVVYSIIGEQQSYQAQTYYSHQMSEHPTIVFRHYDFITKPDLAAEIVEKVNNIIEVRSSSIRREYFSRYPSPVKRKRNTFSLLKS